jgi:hypothetical protein
MSLEIVPSRAEHIPELARIVFEAFNAFHYQRLLK